MALLTSSSPECGMVFYRTASGLEDDLSRVTVLEDEDEITQRQIEEDVHVFGSRPAPQDLEEGLEAMKAEPSGESHKSALSEVFPSRRSRKRKASDAGHRTVSAIDWDDGESPIYSWLTQSAIPPAYPVLQRKPEEQSSEAQEAIVREEKELELYKKVHILTASDPLKVPLDTMERAEDEDNELESGAQIYRRNIIDRFPNIPRYLARRLAKANLNRAKRLHRQEPYGQDLETDEPHQCKDYFFPPPTSLFGGRRLGNDSKRLRTSDVLTGEHGFVCEICSKTFPRACALR